VRIRLATAVVVAVLAVTAPAAQAAPRVVEEGAYRIVGENGSCLRGEGSPSALVTLGACDTIWTITRRGGEGFTITHAARRTCLDESLLKIWPPRVATLPCDFHPVEPWAVQEVWGGRVRFLHHDLVLTGYGEYVVLLRDDEPGQVWSLRRV
jgi:hypothetical protein